MNFNRYSDSFVLDHPVAVDSIERENASDDGLNK